jgi:hydroxymethylbilane synthase
LVTDVDRADFGAVLARVDSGEAAAAVVPLCDVDMTGAEPAFLEALDVVDVVPAAAQGVVAIEMRADAPDEIARLLTALDDPETRAAVTAERAAMRGLEAGSADPVSAYATVAGADLHLHVRVTNISGTLVLNDESHGPMSDPEFLGTNSAKLLLGRGAARVMRTP